MTNRELLDAARRWAAANYPGCPFEHITIHLRYLPKPVRLVDAPFLARPIAPDEEPEERGRGGLDRCTRDIFAALREAHRPLTLRLLVELMQARCERGDDDEWSQRTIARRLAELMADGTVENPDDARPRGYRFVE